SAPATAAAAFAGAFDRLGLVVRDRPSALPSGPQGAALAMAQIGHDLTGPVAAVEDATRTLGQVWQTYDSAIARAASILRGVPDTATRRDIAESLSGLARSLELPGADLMERQLEAMGNVSRHLRPMTLTVGKALKLIHGIQSSARSWSEHIDS
ncbi:MAG: hypothetical protein ABWZ77_06680, partial [Naasia sp.]